MEGASQFLLETVERFFCTNGPLSSTFSSQKVGEGGGDPSVVGNVFPQPAAHTEELLEALFTGRDFRDSDSFLVCFLRLIALCGDDVTEIGQLMGPEMTFLQMRLQMMTIESFEDKSKVDEMLRSGPRLDDDVVQIHFAEISEVASQNLSHQSLKCAGGILQAEGHDSKLVGPAIGSRECGVLVASAAHRYLPIPALEVDGREDGRSPHFFQRLVNNWDGLDGLFGDLI